MYTLQVTVYNNQISYEQYLQLSIPVMMHKKIQEKKKKKKKRKEPLSKEIKISIVHVRDNPKSAFCSFILYHLTRIGSAPIEV